MKKNIFYNILCCLLTLCITGCTDNEGQQKATLVAIRPAIGTTGTEVTLYGEGFHPVASENIIQVYGETAEVTEVNPNEYIKFIAPENPLGSFPVMLTTFTCIHKETKEKIKYDEYKKLSEKEQEQYNVFPRMQVFRVFNVAQTNLRETRPELWEKLEQEVARPKIEDGEHLSFAPVDTMIRDNLWICPIRPKHQDSAYYSISKNEIVVPEKEQFKSGEAFYGTLFHEMTHSTGAEGVLDRIKPTAFGSAEYAREELVAELGSALVAQRYGMAKHIKEDSCAYLKGWLNELKESPQFIKTTLLDVKRASSLITQKVDKIAMELEQGLGRNGRPTGSPLRRGPSTPRRPISSSTTIRSSSTN